jgi:hypothetical protein
LLSNLVNRPCTLIQRAPGSTDELGNDIHAEVEVDTVCEIQQQRREEPGNAGEVSITEWVGFFLPGTDLRTGDAVRVEGEGEFELVGDPWSTRNPRTQAFGQVEVSLRKVAGAEDVS